MYTTESRHSMCITLDVCVLLWLCFMSKGKHEYNSRIFCIYYLIGCVKEKQISNELYSICIFYGKFAFELKVHFLFFFKYLSNVRCLKVALCKFKIKRKMLLIYTQRNVIHQMSKITLLIHEKSVYLFIQICLLCYFHFHLKTCPNTQFLMRQ